MIFRNQGLGRRLILIMTGIVVVMMTAVTLIAATSTQAALHNQTMTSFHQKAGAVARSLTLQFVNLQNTAEDLADDLARFPDLDAMSALRSRITGFSRTMTLSVPVARFAVWQPETFVAALTLTDPDDYTTFQWQVRRQDRNLPDHPALDEAYAADATTWLLLDSPPLPDLSGGQSLAVAVPFNSRAGQSAILWLEISQDQLHTLVADVLQSHALLAEQAGGYALVITDDGRAISAHGLPDSIVQMVSKPLVDQLAQRVTEPGVTAQASLPRDPYSSASAHVSTFALPVPGWRLIAVLPDTAVASLSPQLVGPMIIVAALGLIMMIVVLDRFFAQALVRPLDDLGQAAQQIGGGKHQYVVGYRDQNDEIGRLARALEEMRLDIVDSYEKLAEWSRTLEQRVVDRTRQLEIARKQAQDTASELRAVYDESLLVVNASHLRPVLDQFTERILMLLDATYCSVWLLNEENGKLQMVATTDADHSDDTIVVQMPQGLVGQTIARGQAVIFKTSDSRSDDDFAIPGYQQVPPFAHGMSIPLMFGGKAIGVAVAGRPEGQVPFNDNDRRIMTLFANLVSPSVRNSELFVKLSRAVEAAERANQVKTRFLASVTHELRTPLNLIINNMDFMRVGTFGSVTEDQEERLTQTVRSAEHLLYLINDLLDVSKIEAGEMQLFIDETDPYQVIEDSLDTTLAFMEQLGPGKMDKVALRSELDEDLPRIPMDGRRIRQVLTNLLSNGIKFTQQGSVTLRVKREDASVVFSVEDTGIGIPPQEIAHLFEAFERTSNARAGNIEGTGLGLPISQHLVRAHGGDLTVSSVVGKGTTFTFALPILPPEKTSDLRNRTDTQILEMLLSGSGSDTGRETS